MRRWVLSALLAFTACTGPGQEGGPGQVEPLRSPWLSPERLPAESTLVEILTINPRQSLRSPVQPDGRIPEAPRVIGGALTLPPGAGPFPAVVVLHSTAGIDGRATPYVQALREAGIAALQIDMWGPRGVLPGVDLSRARPRSTFHTIADAVGALAFLAAHPKIDRDRIGVMGQSWGAVMGLLLASPEVRSAFPKPDVWFKGVASLYPVCWAFAVPGTASHRVVAGRWPLMPILVLAAGIEDYDTRPDGQDCRDAFGGRTSPQSGAPVLLHVYDGVTHAWDRLRQGEVTFFDPAAAGGRGGPVRVVRNEEAARDSVRRVRDFFATVLTPSPPSGLR